MRKLLAAVFALALATAACIGGGSNDRTILVDFSHDEFSSMMVDNFPDRVDVTPGMSVVFKQTWTGEPHTVTAGTLVNEMIEKTEPWTRFFEGFEALAATADLPDPDEPQGSARDLFGAIDEAENEEMRDRFYEAFDDLREMGVDLPDRRDPGDATFESLVQTADRESESAFEDLGIPWALDETDDGEFFATQNAGQPCYLDEGSPPEDAERPCRDAQQQQPAFTGDQSYYNSGIIPYEGPQGNTFRVKLAPEIAPGSYFFYCAVHGPNQATEVRVRPEGSDIAEQEDVSRAAREQIGRFAEPMVEVYEDARDGELEMQGQTVEGPFAGLFAPVFGAINEFIPGTINAKVGEPVTWKAMGWDHTISFDPPRYFPIIRFADDGAVSLNPQLNRPAGGHPEIPEQAGEGILRIDGGTYDGEGFYSSGVFSAEPYAEYTLRFSRPGTYRYACLLHPPMVGSVDVR
ncbi:MAG: cupredoxin domain-containing protein [Actinomycetota bacterium]